MAYTITKKYKSYSLQITHKTAGVLQSNIEET